MSFDTVSYFDKKSVERDINRMDYKQMTRIIDNMSPIDYTLSFFKKENDTLLIEKEKEKQVASDLDNDYEPYFKFDEEDQELVDINYNDDIALKHLDY